MTQKFYIFLHLVQHNSRSLRLIDQYKFYTDYMWIMCATFSVWFKFLNLLVFEISGTQISGKRKNLKNFACLNRYSLSLHSVYHFEILISSNIETYETLLSFFDFKYLSVFEIEAFKNRYGRAGLGCAWPGRAGPGQADSLFQSIMLVLRLPYKYISIFSDFLKGFRAVWMSSRLPICDC